MGSELVVIVMNEADRWDLPLYLTQVVFRWGGGTNPWYWILGVAADGLAWVGGEKRLEVKKKKNERMEIMSVRKVNLLVVKV